MSKHGGPAYQVTQVLKQGFMPGTSREADKQKGLTDGRIYSIRTMRTYVRDNTRFFKWARDRYQVRDIRNLTPAMARAYLNHLADNECSGGYLGRVKAAIGKLSVILTGQRWDLGRGWHSDRRPERAYSREDGQRIVQDLRGHARDPQIQDVVQIQLAGGLRIREAVQLRAQDLDPERCIIRLQRGTKGGRPRSVRVHPRYRPLLARLKDRAARRRDGHLFAGRGSLAQRTRRAVRESCNRLGSECFGTHGFRKTFAQGRYKSYRAQGLTDTEARQSLARDLGHGRIDVTKSYV